MSDVRVRRLRSVSSAEDGHCDAATLLQQAGRSDEAAFSSLYDQLSPLVYGVILRVVTDPSMAAEVSQEVFIELGRIASRYDATFGSVRSWAPVNRAPAMLAIVWCTGPPRYLVFGNKSGGESRAA